MKKRIRLFISSLFDMFGIFSLILFLNRIFQRQRAVILMYHRVFNLWDEDHFQFYLKGPDNKNFERQIRYLSKHCNLMDLEEFTSLCRAKKRIPPNTVVITIDDGYIDCYLNIFPILKRYGAPATIFLSTDFVGTKKPFWWDEVAYLIRNARSRIFRVDGLGRFKIITVEEKSKAIDAIIAMFKAMKEEDRKQAMDRLRNELTDGDDVSSRLNLDWRHVKEMAGHGVSFGAHTVSHPILSRLKDEDAKEEILNSKNRIEKELRSPVATFCYPSGEPDKFNEFHKEVLKENGFLCAVSTISGPVNNKSDLFALERISVDRGDTMPLFKAKLTGIFEIKRWIRSIGL